MLVAEINNRVRDKVNSANIEIITGMYERIIHSHNDFCGCNYCLILKEYVDKKKQLIRVKRKILDTNNEYTCSFLYQTLHRLEREIASLKIEKDKLKLF